MADTKVYHDGHSNRNVKTKGALLRNRQIHTHTVFHKTYFGCDDDFIGMAASWLD